MPDSQDSQASRGFSDRAKEFIAFGSVVALFVAGFTISTGFWSSSNATLQNDLRHSQDEVARAKQELADLKSEYAVFRQKCIAPGSLPRGSSGRPLGSGESAPSAKGQAYEEIDIAPEQTAYPFNGEISISLVAIAFEGDPLRHRVIATVGSPGFPSLTIDRKDVGFSTTFKARDSFSIAVTAANTFLAQFRVTRVPK